MVAWSTPGAAVLASAGLAGGFTMPQAVGAFILCAVLIMLAGATGWFEAGDEPDSRGDCLGLVGGSALARFGLQGLWPPKSHCPWSP